MDPRSADHESWLQWWRIVAGEQARFAIEYSARPLGHAVRYEVEAETTEQMEADGMVRTTLADTPIAFEPGPSARFSRVTIGRAHSQP